MTSRRIKLEYNLYIEKYILVTGKTQGVMYILITATIGYTTYTVTLMSSDILSQALLRNSF